MILTMNLIFPLLQRCEKNICIFAYFFKKENISVVIIKFYSILNIFLHFFVQDYFSEILSSPEIRVFVEFDFFTIMFSI